MSKQIVCNKRTLLLLLLLVKAFYKVFMGLTCLNNARACNYTSIHFKLTGGRWKEVSLEDTNYYNTVSTSKMCTVNRTVALFQ